ncbi:vitrin isoform X6 [Arapaima gigas]
MRFEWRHAEAHSVPALGVSCYVSQDKAVAFYTAQFSVLNNSSSGKWVVLPPYTKDDPPQGVALSLKPPLMVPKDPDWTANLKKEELDCVMQLTAMWQQDRVTWLQATFGTRPSENQRRALRPLGTLVHRFTPFYTVFHPRLRRRAAGTQRDRQCDRRPPSRTASRAPGPDRRPVMAAAALLAVCVVLLLTSGSEAKPNEQKNKKPNPAVPSIDCNLRAGNVNLPEFIAKCPARCRETKQPVYGTGIFASISSICNAAIHGGIIPNAGGRVIVKKMAGQAAYRGSLSYGVRSLSLPKWRDSFIVSAGKPKKGVIYPSTLEYTNPRPTFGKTDQTEAVLSTPLQMAAMPPDTPAATTIIAASSTTTTTPPPPSTTTAKLRIAVHKVREAGESPKHTFFGTGREKITARRSNVHCIRCIRQPLSANYLLCRRTETLSLPGLCSALAFSPRGQPAPAERSQHTLQSNPTSRSGDPESRKTLAEVVHTAVESIDTWKPEVSPFDSGFGSREQDSLVRVPEPISQGNPNCKVDIAFLMDGSWSIGKRRFKIQKDFLAEVSQTINVGVAGPMMGIIQYGDDPVTEFGLKSHSSSQDLKPAIEKIVQKGGLSNVGKALTYINKHFFSDVNGNRGGAPNVAVVLVDGWPTDRVEEASRLARESGINIFFVTVEGPDDSEKHNVAEANFVEKAVCRTSGFFSLAVPSWFNLRKVAQTLVKRVCDADRLVCSKTCLNANDIAFVIDGSSSVGTANFRTVLQFVANVTREFEISDTDTRVGAVQYTYEQRLEFAFGQHSSKAELLGAIKRINYWSGGTSTGAAITFTAEQLFSKSKPNKRKIMIVITDGRSYDDVRAPALAVQRSGVIAYSIGIAWAAQEELEYIATDPDKEHSFFVDEFDNLYKFVPKIIHNICQEFNSQPRN